MISVHDAIKKSRDSNCIADIAIWRMFGKFKISIEKLSLLQFYKDLTRKTLFVEGWSWFKFNNLALALGMTLKCHKNVAKESKLKVNMFWKLSPNFRKVTGENW